MNESLINSTLILCKTCAILLEKVDKGKVQAHETRSDCPSSRFIVCKILCSLDYPVLPSQTLC